jgi:flagellar hook-associated protein 3 FlgL
MRVNPNMVPNILSDLQQNQSSVNNWLQQLSSGLRVSQPSDDPAASAGMVQNGIQSANVDQYTKNVSSVLTMAQSADSALSSVVTSLTKAISLGTEGANGTNTLANQQTIAEQVQGILTSVVSQANASYSGVYLFGGTATSSAPYTADSASATGYTYNGNDNSNSVQIGDNLSVQVNLPGSQIFSNSTTDVIGSLSNLVSALQSGDTTAIGDATSAVSSALNYVSQQRVFYGNVESQLNSQETYLQKETVNLTSQAKTLVGADIAHVAIMLAQAQTANSAAQAAAAKVLPETILNYLSTPN